MKKKAEKTKARIGVKVAQSDDPKRARIALSFEFSADDPQAERIYRGVGLLLKEALTGEEAREFMGRLDVERAKLASKAGGASGNSPSADDQG